MTVLLSIKPQFANKIFDGTKTFEFRKAIFKQPNVKRVVVYASAPIKQVIGEFSIGEILEDDLDTIWQKTQHGAGITRDFFDRYFSNKEKAYAITIAKAHRYAKSRSLQDYNISTAPQSFAYVEIE